MKPYTVSYRHKGREYVIEVYAESVTDARERLGSAYFNGQPDELVASVKAPGWLSRVFGGEL